MSFDAFIESAWREHAEQARALQHHARIPADEQAWCRDDLAALAKR
jgi:hypothetical protein